MKLQKQAFTLVELIVVVTILAVLATIGFVSYSGYLAGTRDTNRISNLKALSDGLELYNTKSDLPLPEDYVEVISKGEVIGYQGYVGQNVLETIEFSNGGKDPKYENYYSYYLTSDRRYFQLMGYLEEEENLQSDISTKVNAEIADYSVLYPIVYGQKLGILTDTTNTPIQEVSSVKSAGYIDLGGTNSGTIYKAHINDGRIYSFTGYILEDKLYTLSNPDKYGAPKDCPEGFIGVWGDSAFDQLGFCVAKYEMTYTEEDVITATFDTGYNTYLYDQTKSITSRSGDYPVANLTQSQAIDACKSMGDGYHLIMDKEWMSIARDIELQDKNWSGGSFGVGGIYRGNNGEENTSELGCKDGNNKAFSSRTWNDYTCKGKRQLTLFNGAIIEDFAGNVREHVNKADTVDGVGYDTGTNPDLSSCSEWTGCSLSYRELYGSLFLNFDSTNGIGKPVWSGGNIFIRGCSADHTTTAGIYALSLSQTSSSVSTHVGFRCAYMK